MTAAWTEGELQRIDDARELRITSERDDGTPPREVPIWVVSTRGQVFVRTWYRRHSGWFGHAIRSHRARIRVPGLDAIVDVEDIGDQPADLSAEVGAAYRAKYGGPGTSVDQMVTEAAAASTLRLVRARGS